MLLPAPSKIAPDFTRRNLAVDWSSSLSSFSSSLFPAPLFVAFVGLVSLSIGLFPTVFFFRFLAYFMILLPMAAEGLNKKDRLINSDCYAHGADLIALTHPSTT